MSNKLHFAEVHSLVFCVLQFNARLRVVLSMKGNLRPVAIGASGVGWPLSPVYWTCNFMCSREGVECSRQAREGTVTGLFDHSCLKGWRILELRVYLLLTK